MNIVAKVGIGVFAFIFMIVVIEDLSGDLPAATPNENLAAPAAEPSSIEDPSGPIAFPRRANMVKIENYAVTPYTPSEYPTTFRKFGSLVGEINQDRQKAAEIAATYTDCDFVQNAQISTSSPKTNRHYWVECGNLTRVYIDQESLAKAEAVDLQTKSDWIKAGLKDW